MLPHAVLPIIPPPPLEGTPPSPLNPRSTPRRCGPWSEGAPYKQTVSDHPESGRLVVPDPDERDPDGRDALAPADGSHHDADRMATDQTLMRLTSTRS